MEIGMAFFQGLDEILIGFDGYSRDLAEIFEVGVVDFGIFRVHGLVGPERGEHLRLRRLVRRYLFMAGEIVRRVVGGADDLDLEFLHERSGREIHALEQVVRSLPDLFGNEGLRTSKKPK